ncbi:M50 family metallopeptidase [Amycolatopsis sp. NPDC059027]
MFRTALPLGRWAGITVGAHWSVLLVLALLTELLAADVLPRSAPHQPVAAYWIAAVVTAIGFLATLLAHELAHALVARRQGCRVRRITLWMLGGATELDGEPATPRAEMLVAAAGPMTSLLLGGTGLGAAFVLRAWPIPLPLAALYWFGLTNLVLGVFNLLPGAPLDGGRILHALLWQRYGDRVRATEIATRAGQGFGLLVAAMGLAEMLFGGISGLWLVFVGWFLLAAAQAELTGHTVRERLGGLAVRAVMDPAPVTAPEWLTIEGFLDQLTPSTRQRAFPVVSFNGKPTGVISLGELTRLTPQDRLNIRVADVCRTAPKVSVVDAGTQVADLLSKTVLRQGRDLVLVVEDDRLSGVVDADDLARAAELALLGRPVPADG